MPRKARQDLTGQTFGLLEVLKFDVREVRRCSRGDGGYVTVTAIRWLCECACGRRKGIRASALRNGQKSCGCIPPGPKKGTRYRTVRVHA